LKRTYSVSTLLSLTTGAMIVVLVTVFAVVANHAWRREQNSAAIAASARVTRDIVSVRETLRAELGVIDTSIADPMIADQATIQHLKQLHGRTLEAMHRVQREIAALGAEKVPPDVARKIARGIANFDQEVFPAVLAAAQLPREHRPPNLLSDPQNSVYALLNWVDDQATILSHQIAVTGPYMSEMMRISDVAWRIRVDAGAERRYYANFIAWPHKPSQMERDRLIRLEGRTMAPWESIEKTSRSEAMAAPLKIAIAHAKNDYFGRYARLRVHVLDAMENGTPLAITGPHWLEVSTPALNSVMDVSRSALAAAEARAMANLATERTDLKNALLQMGLCVALAVFTAFLVLWRVIRPLKQITHAITHNEEADIERVLAISARGDEIGQFALALKSFRKLSDDRQRLERELLQNRVARESAEAASKVKSEFLANMSHELRTPLNAVIGFSEMMMHATFGPIAERYLEYATLINNSGNHLLSLVTDILDLAKIEAGRFQADFRDFDLKSCVQECLPLISSKAAAREITLEADLPPADVVVSADARACKQILINLLSNAVKFSEEKGVITVTLRDFGDTVQFSVKDDGTGIPADVLERIGQPFEQATNNPHVAREGTGLGLSLVKALVGEHGGKMAVESREDEGTLVTITLPRRQDGRKIQRAA
jgi:signal transduction histidine kinase